jgi:hypothetical protein
MSTEIPEEKKKKMMEALDAIKNQYSSADLANMIKMDHEKLIECRHEIVISVLANVMEEDDTGQTVGSKEICKKNYHIPVPPNKDYQEYLSGFFNFLEGCMSSSVEQVEQTVKEETTNG